MTRCTVSCVSGFVGVTCIFLMAATSSGPSKVTAQTPAYDLVIRNGTVVDGTGAPGVKADVAVAGDTIVALAPGVTAGARRIIDAQGLVVAPGFIDMHTHSDSALLEDGRAASFLMQGVTTEVLGEHSSAGPILGKAERGMFSLTEDAQTKAPTPDWTTLGGYFRKLEASQTSINVASYVGSGQVRACVVGYENRPATPDELEQMKRLVADAMRDGAVGVSSGLAYVPNIYATTDELTALARVAAEHGGYYATHLRASTREDPLSGLKEAIATAEGARSPLEIIHVNSTAGGRIGEFAALIDAARARGLDITANFYPYIAGMSFLRSLLPPWAQEGGTGAMLARLRNPEDRARMQQTLGQSDPARWQRTFVSSTNRAIDGRTIADLAAARQVAPAVALMDIVLEEGGYAFYISFGNTEENLKKGMVLPWVHFGSDGASVTLGTFKGGKPHPRFFGTFARVLAKYVREEHTLTLEQAIYRMTQSSARRLGFDDRGQIAVGKKADLVVFNPQTIADRATFENPLQYSAGVLFVVVNGVIVVDNGAHTGAKPGRVLRHKG
jgi:N-acyl-D-aspartate/D-glutamate deacylase